MAEWVTHICLAYGIGTVASWYLDWLDVKWVSVGVVGSILPDLSRLKLVLPGDLITGVAGVPFSWDGIHTVGGILLVSAIGAVLFTSRRHQLRGFLLLLAGALSHLLVDLPQQYADGRMLTNEYLFPLPPWRPPTPGWYVSADRWVVVLALTLAVAIFAADQYRIRQQSPEKPDQ